MQPFSPWHFWTGTALLAVVLLFGAWLIDRRAAKRARAHDEADNARLEELKREIKGAKALGSSAYGRYEATDRAIRDLYDKYRRHDELIANEHGIDPAPVNDVEQEWTKSKG